MEVRKMFGVYDAGMDGRERPILKGVYHTEQEAAQRAGPYRHTSPVWMVGPTDDGQWYVLESVHTVAVGVDFDAHRKAVREAAKAKLTPSERAVLGLD